MGNSNMIYADNAATTRISDNVIEKMIPFLKEHYGNPSSQYSFGLAAKRAVDKARIQFASALNASPDEIVFTSGGSEGNNWVLFGVAASLGDVKGHIITSSIEHHSILNACKAIEKQGVEVTYLPVDRYGRVSPADVRKAVQKDTVLVSIMLANNEIGTLQPISEIGQFLRSKGILFHTDAVQAIGHIPVDVVDLGIDFLTASSHKFNGPKGVGILYKRRGVELPPLIYGGEQERNLRAGTENVAGIVGAGFAMEESVAELCLNYEKLRILAISTIEGIQSRIPNLIVNGHPEHRLPGIVNLTFEGVSGESLMHLLDLKGLCVSTSSACSSGSNKPSHVLLATGLSDKQAKETIRISYGKYNDIAEVTQIVNFVCDAYQKIRTASTKNTIM
jgi:cysteine desulfurase